MAKTKKQLIQDYAEKLGGERGEKIRTALEGPLLKGLKMWDEQMSDEQFEVQWGRIERASAKLDDLEKKGWPGAPDGTWGVN